MAALRYRPNQVCAYVLCEIPQGIVHIKKAPIEGEPASVVALKWLGFICTVGARKYYGGRKCKLVARSISNGNGVTGQWVDLDSDQYVVGLAVELGKNNFGAYGIVGADGWPVCRTENGPNLTIVQRSRRSQLIKIGTR